MAKTSLKQVGGDLAANGYIFTPIRQKSKAPLFKNWTTNDFDYDEWIERYPNLGAGILTANNPAVDLDIPDVELVEYMADYIDLVYGLSLIHI